MKILRLQAENIKKLTVVEISPKGNLIEISGSNGSGKTSVLDAIWWALAGADKIQDQPIRKGENKAKITLELGTKKVELTVERRFTKDNSYLTVSTVDGATYPKPQRLLDDMLGALSLDPIAFLHSDRKAQYDQLRSLVKLPVDPTKVAELNKRDYERRADLNRDAKKLRIQAEGIEVQKDLPDAPINELSIFDELQAMGKHNTEIVRQQRIRENDADVIRRFRQNAAEWQAKAAELIKEAESLERDADAKQAALDAMEPLPEPHGAEAHAPLRKRLAQAKEINAAIALARDRKGIENDAKRLERESEALTKAMEDRVKALDEALANATLPVPGLGFGDGTVTLNGIPLDQASDAEQLLASTAIAAAQSPKLRVLRIRDGSLLDDAHIAWLTEFAEKNDLQVWIETVGDGGPAAIVMEDGHIKAQQAAE